MASSIVPAHISKLQAALRGAQWDVQRARGTLVDKYGGEAYFLRSAVSQLLRLVVNAKPQHEPVKPNDFPPLLDRALSECSPAMLKVADQFPPIVQDLLQKLEEKQRVASELQKATERHSEQQAASWEAVKPLVEARLRDLKAKMELDFDAKLRALRCDFDAKIHALDAKMAGSPSPPGGFMAPPPGSEVFDFVTQPLGGSGNDGSPSAPVDDESIATEPEPQLNGEQPDHGVDSKNPPKGNPQPDDGREKTKRKKAKHVYITRNGRWVAKLYHNKKMHHLGTHDTAAQAAKKYNEAALRFGMPEVDVPPPSETPPPARQLRAAKKGRKRKRRDDKDPKIKTRHYKNAYTFFLMDKEVRKRAESSLSSADARKLSQVTKKIAQMWDKLDDEAKVPYEKKSQADKKRVNEEVDKLQAELARRNQMAQDPAGCVHAASSSRDATPAAMDVTDTDTAVPDPANAAAAPAAKRPRIDSNETAQAI